MADDFMLWLEFESYNEVEEREYCNLQITCGETKYALNVWTYDFLMKLLQEKTTALTYEVAPDLIVDKITRENLQAIVSKMIEEGELKPEWIRATASKKELTLRLEEKAVTVPVSAFNSESRSRCHPREGGGPSETAQMDSRFVARE
jgi:hypothetical protein